MSNIPSIDQVMELTRTVSSHTAFEDEECRALYDLCCQMQPYSNVVEIGCQLGRTSSIIAQVGNAIGYQSIHIDPYTVQFEYLRGWIEMMHKISHPFTLLCMRTDQAQVELERLRGIDLLLIDGDHTEDGVGKDCLVAGERVRIGGIMCAHDFGRESWPEVYRVISAYAVAPRWETIGVYGTLGVFKRCA